MSIELSYLSAARYDDEIAITTSPGEANRHFVAFDDEMKCAGRRVATGQTKHIFLNRDFRPMRLPDKFAPLLASNRSPRLFSNRGTRLRQKTTVLMAGHPGCTPTPHCPLQDL